MQCNVSVTRCTSRSEKTPHAVIYSPHDPRFGAKKCRKTFQVPVKALRTPAFNLVCTLSPAAVLTQINSPPPKMIHSAHVFLLTPFNCHIGSIDSCEQSAAIRQAASMSIK
jgi:hypothetical protein